MGVCLCVRVRTHSCVQFFSSSSLTQSHPLPFQSQYLPILMTATSLSLHNALQG